MKLLGTLHSKRNDASFHPDKLPRTICSVETAVLNFRCFRHHFLIVHINLSSQPKRIQQELKAQISNHFFWAEGLI